METICWNNKKYACEFITSVEAEGEELKGSFKIYVSRHVMRAFLVDDFNKVIAQRIVFSIHELDALLNNEDKHHEKEINKLCNYFAESIYLETWDEVNINPLPLRREH